MSSGNTPFGVSSAVTAAARPSRSAAVTRPFPPCRSLFGRTNSLDARLGVRVGLLALTSRLVRVAVSVAVCLRPTLARRARDDVAEFQRGRTRQKPTQFTRHRPTEQL